MDGHRGICRTNIIALRLTLSECRERFFSSPILDVSHFSRKARPPTIGMTSLHPFNNRDASQERGQEREESKSV